MQPDLASLGSVSNHFINGDSVIAQQIRDFDWSSTSLGPLSNWPGSVVSMVNTILQSPVPMALFVGNDGYFIYNHAYFSLLRGCRSSQLGAKLAIRKSKVAGINPFTLNAILSGTMSQCVEEKQRIYCSKEIGEPYFNFSYSQILNESGTVCGVLLVLMESTEYLREQEKRLEAALEHAPALIAIFSGKNIIVEMANKSFVEHFAMGRDIVGKPLFEVVPELKQRGDHLHLRRALETGKPFVGVAKPLQGAFETDKYKDTYFKYANVPYASRVGNKLDKILMHAVDITDQVKTSLKAEQFSSLLEAVVNSLPDGLYIAEGGEITHINQRGAEMLGYESPEQVPRKYSEIFEQPRVRFTEDGKNIDLKMTGLERARKGETVTRFGIEATNILTGKRMVLRTAGRPIRDTTGKIIGTLAVSVDLTEIYELQSKVRAKEVQKRLLTEKSKLLRFQNKELKRLNAAKDEFIALASHQLRTPATGVKQYIAMLLQGYAGKLTPKQLEFLERAYDSNEQQLHIIEDILRVAKVDVGQTRVSRRPTNICALVHSLVDEQRTKFAEDSISIVTEFPEKPIQINIDPILMRMAIGNVVDNARKYTPKGKKVSVSVGTTDAGYVSIIVADEGVGIAKKDMQDLFLKFSRIPNPLSVRAGGTGLGLYWARHVIELHGGDIVVQSKVGKGAIFTVKLPLS